MEGVYKEMKLVVSRQQKKFIPRMATIAVIGADGVKKTNTVEKIRSFLVKNKLRVKVYRFPDRNTKIGKLIDAALKREIVFPDIVFHILQCANRCEFAAEIRENLNNGIIFPLIFWAEGQ